MSQLKRAFDLEAVDEQRNAPTYIDVVRNVVVRSRRHQFIAYLVAALCMGLVVWQFIFATEPVRSADAVSARIVTVRHLANTSSQLELIGTISGDPAESTLALFIERDGLVWPKEAEMRIEGQQWRAIIFDHGIKEGAFKISLWALPPAANEQVRQWFARGRVSQAYPGVAGIHGAVWQDAVTVEVSAD